MHWPVKYRSLWKYVFHLIHYAFGREEKKEVQELIEFNALETVAESLYT